jgi:type VI protein secretion system component VasF
MPTIAWPTLAPWHVALALAVACLAAFVFSRVQVNRARDDFSNAFFYAPSQKEHHRQRRRRWTDVSRALLVATALAGVLTAWLYVINGQG